jgi:hypothetical protein
MGIPVPPRENGAIMMKRSWIVAVGGFLAALAFAGAPAQAGPLFTFQYTAQVTSVVNPPAGVGIQKGDIVTGIIAYDPTLPGSVTFTFSGSTTFRHNFAMGVGSFNDGSPLPTSAQDNFVITITYVDGAVSSTNPNIFNLHTSTKGTAGKAGGGFADISLFDTTGAGITTDTKLPTSLNLANFKGGGKLVYDPSDFEIDADILSIADPVVSPDLVPEPGTLAGAAIGLGAGLFVLLRRRWAR